jgi:hypothetical protein
VHTLQQTASLEVTFDFFLAGQGIPCATRIRAANNVIRDSLHAFNVKRTLRIKRLPFRALQDKVHGPGGKFMALGVYFSPKDPMSAEKYNECIKQLKKAGAHHPAGRLYHASFGPPENLAVFDIWTSQAAFDKFGKTLFPILQQIGLDPGAPQVMNVHNVIVPPSKKAAASKPAAAKGKAKPKGAVARKKAKKK